jgi:hypothetical protein
VRIITYDQITTAEGTAQSSAWWQGCGPGPGPPQQTGRGSSCNSNVGASAQLQER